MGTLVPRSTSDHVHLEEAATDRHQDSTTDKFAELFSRHSAWLANQLRRRVSADVIEDVVQETYLRLGRSYSSMEIRHPRALILKVAHNIVIEGARRRRGASFVSLSDERQREWDQPEPGDQFERLVWKDLILSLPEHCREVFLLNRFSGLTYEEIADKCDLPVKTVEKRMSRALKICKARMRD